MGCNTSTVEIVSRTMNFAGSNSANALTTVSGRIPSDQSPRARKRPGLFLWSSLGSDLCLHRRLCAFGAKGNSVLIVRNGISDSISSMRSGLTHGSAIRVGPLTLMSEFEVERRRERSERNRRWACPFINNVNGCSSRPGEVEASSEEVLHDHHGKVVAGTDARRRVSLSRRDGDPDLRICRSVAA